MVPGMGASTVAALARSLSETRGVGGWAGRWPAGVDGLARRAGGHDLRPHRGLGGGALPLDLDAEGPAVDGDLDGATC